MAGAIIFIVGGALLWLAISGIIYGGFAILRFFTLLPVNFYISFDDALKYGEIIAIALVMTFIIAMILNRIGVIDFRCFKASRLSKGDKR